MAEVAKAAPDGLTLGVATLSTHGVNPAVYKKLPYDPIKDFVAVTELVKAPGVVVVNAALPVKDFAELIQYLKANPGKLSYASPGNGTIGHMWGELFKSTTNTFMVHIPYRRRPRPERRRRRAGDGVFRPSRRFAAVHPVGQVARHRGVVEQTPGGAAQHADLWRALLVFQQRPVVVRPGGARWYGTSRGQPHPASRGQGLAGTGRSRQGGRAGAVCFRVLAQ